MTCAMFILGNSLLKTKRTLSRAPKPLRLQLVRGPFATASPPEPVALGGLSLRFFLYSVFLGGVLLAALLGLREFGVTAMLGESGAIELGQVALLGATGALLLFSKKHPSAAALQLGGILIAVLLVRELDALFDVMLYHGAWKLPALALLGVALRHAIRNREALSRGVRAQVKQRSTGLFFTAFAIVLVQSRLMGMQDAWRAILGESYEREFPRLIEELLELSGYALLVVAAVEARFEARRLRSN